MTISTHFFDRCLNFLSQSQFKHNIEIFWRARALQSANIILMLIYLAAIGLVVAAQPMGAFSNRYASLALTPAFVLTFLSLWMTYRGRFLFFNIHLTIMSMFICAASGIYFSGGPDVSSNNQHLIIQVAVGFFLAGIRGGLVWLAIIIVVEVFFYWLVASGYVFRSYEEPSHRFSGEIANFFLALFIVAIIVSLMDFNRSNLDRYREIETSRFQYKATHDSLTQLANRELLYSSMVKTVQLCQNNASRALLFYLDLNNFKPINDNFGHACGDRVLQIVAARLQTMVRKNDVVARVGGDEFAILFQRTEAEPPERMTTALADHLSAPIHLFGQQFSVGCSIGICEIDGSNSNIDELLAKADNAMYQAKKSHQLWVLEADVVKADTGEKAG